MQVDRLQKELASEKDQKNDSYKERYEKVLAENAELKKQLRASYKY